MLESRALIVGCVWLASLLACGGTKATGDAGTHDAPRDTAVPDALPSQITVTLDGRPTDPAPTKFVVAYQDGDKPWVAAPPPNGDRYSFTVDSDIWAVAWTCGFDAGSGYRIVMVARFTVAERTHVEMPIPAYCTGAAAPPATATLGGNATSFVAGTTIQFETAMGFPSGGSYQVTAPLGTADLVAFHTISPGGNFNTTVDDALVVRGIALNGPTTADLDWASAVATSSMPMTISSAPVGSMYWVDTILHATGTSVPLMTSVTTPPLTETLGATQGSSSDVYEQRVWIGSGPDALVGTSSRTTIAGPTPTAMLTAPAPFLRSSVSTSFVPSSHVQTQWPAYAGAGGYALMSQEDDPGTCTAPSGGCYRIWFGIVSAGAACTGLQCSYQTPDLSTAGIGSEFDLMPAAATYSVVDVRLSNTLDFPDPELVPFYLDFLHVPYPVPASGTIRTIVREQ